MQIVHSGKLLWFQCLAEIRGKTFVVVLFMQYLLTSFMKLSVENFHGSYVANSQKLQKFSTMNDLHYMVFHGHPIIMHLCLCRHSASYSYHIMSLNKAY